MVVVTGEAVETPVVEPPVVEPVETPAHTTTTGLN